ncbi:DUF5129 domain-containing protein [Arthrobacter sp.]|uniref:DUF5129 domain-containing protein n=1 Tax=Arthrobacter sp. TaxID=1667 RepID=UPI00367139B5
MATRTMTDHTDAARRREARGARMSGTPARRPTTRVADPRAGVPAASGPRRPALWRAAAAGMLLLLGALGPAPAALADGPTEIVVEDTAGVLDRNTLLPALEAIDFHEPTKVAVFTERGGAGDNFNERVLAFARDQHPEWISADGQKWTDGLFLFAFDPDGRHVGTYMGEDRKVSPEQRTDIQESTYDLLRDAQWTDAAIRGVESAAAVMNRPWYRSPLTYVLGGAAVLVGGGAAAGYVWTRARNRGRFAAALERGNKSYSNVTMDLDVTELNANTIPADSKYGALVLERYRNFRSAYGELHDRKTVLEATSRKRRSTRAAALDAERYADDAVRLDALDDVIADSNDLLNRAARWAEAWDRQTGGFRRELDGLDEAPGGAGALRDSATGAALLAYRDTARRNLERWGTALGDGSLTPDQALDSLKAARDEFSELLGRHAETVIDAFAESSDEARTMRRQMEKARQESSAPRPRGMGILDAAYPAHYYFTVPSFHSGYSAGQNEVASDRSAASGGSTGYGASGGSFSGSGSSSRF